MSNHTRLDAVELFLERGLHIPTRTIYLGDSELPDGSAEIGHRTSADLLRGLHVLSHISAELPVTIYLNSGGGDLYHALAIYDAIRRCQFPVFIVGTGHVMSAATLILQAADRRLLTPTCHVMVHDGETGYTGHPRDFERWARHGQQMRQLMYKILAEKSGKTAAFWDKHLSGDRIYTAEEAVSLGLADSLTPD